MSMRIPKKLKTDVGIATYNPIAKRYYANKGRRKRIPLAKKVYIACHGKIPKGYEIHHVDGDKFNNHISNLIAVSHEDHMKLHRSKNVKYDIVVIDNEIREEDPVVFLTFSGGGKK